MFFPEFLYKLGERDKQITWLDYVHQTIQTSTAGTNVEAEFVVPAGQALLLSNVVNLCSPGAGQSVTRQSFGLATPGLIATGVFTNLRREEWTPAIDILRNLNWTGWAIVPPRWSVRAQGIYNAGVAANITNLHLHGMLIPVGNLQRT